MTVASTFYFYNLWQQAQQHFSLIRPSPVPAKASATKQAPAEKNISFGG